MALEPLLRRRRDRQPDENPDLGLAIKRARQRLGMTQQEMANRLGADRATVAIWETGRQYPLRYAGAIEALLGITIPRKPAA